MKARALVGRGKKSLLSGPGAELLLGGGRRNVIAKINKRDEQNKK